MIKHLYWIDPHFVHNKKEEMDNLAAFVCETAYKNNVDKINILGDLNDTFNILRTDNLEFWSKWLVLLCDVCPVKALVGNHDKKNQGDDNNKENSLNIFSCLQTKYVLDIISSPVTFGIFGYMPYIHNKELFVKEANLLAEQGAKVLICHGEFDGGQYDNGHYIPDGVKQELLNFDLIISGHIHTRSAFGKVRNPGTARWITASDANKKKGIWLVEHDEVTGQILKEEFLDTSHICTPIYSYQFKEGDIEPVIPVGSRASVELIGSSEWISKQKPKFKGKASISSKITDKQKPSNRKTGDSLEHFVNNVFEVGTGLNKEKMVKFMRENGIL